MVERTITATELAERLADVLDRVRDRHERFVVERHGEVIATIAPVAVPPPITLRALIARLDALAPPDDGFADDLEEIQASQPPAGASPWPT